MEIEPTDRLQPPFPSVYKVPTLVQPGTTFTNLITSALLNRDISNLEKYLCKFYNVKYCLLLDRARTGAYLLSKTMDLNDEWITTSFMHRPFTVLLANTASSIVFADIGTDFTINTKSAESLISSKSQVLLATHMYGKSANIVELRKIADKHGLFLVENCVHMPGKYQIYKKALGSWGDAALLSFNVDKPLAGLLGGALLTSRDDVWHSVNKIKLENNEVSHVLNRIGSTYVGYYLKSLIIKLGLKKTENVDGVKDIEEFPLSKYTQYSPKKIHYLQKVAAFKNLQKIDMWNIKRRENAVLMTKLLKENQSLILPTDTAERPNSYLYYPVIFKNQNRFSVANKLANKGIETKWRYYPLHMQSEFKTCRYESLENTFNYWKQHLLIPIGHKLKSHHINYVANAILDVVEH